MGRVSGRGGGDGSQRARRCAFRSGMEPTVVYRSEVNGTELAFVAAGTGIARVRELALDGHDERMCALDVDGLLAPRRVGLAWHRERQPSPAARAFMELARSVCGPLGAGSAA